MSRVRTGNAVLGLLELGEAARWWNTQRPLTRHIRSKRMEGFMKPTQPRICQWCKSIILDTGGRGGTQANRKFCSITCKQKARNEASKQPRSYQCPACGESRVLLRPSVQQMCRTCAAAIGTAEASRKLLSIPATKRIRRGVKITEEGCWEWQGTSQPNGYGVFSINNHLQRTHRVSYEAFVAPIPDGLQIDHLCRNRICCNPEHLEPVTPAENTRRARASA